MHRVRVSVDELEHSSCLSLWVCARPGFSRMSFLPSSSLSCLLQASEWNPLCSVVSSQEHGGDR